MNKNKNIIWLIALALVAWFFLRPRNSKTNTAAGALSGAAYGGAGAGAQTNGGRNGSVFSPASGGGGGRSSGGGGGGNSGGGGGGSSLDLGGLLGSLFSGLKSLFGGNSSTPPNTDTNYTGYTSSIVPGIAEEPGQLNMALASYGVGNPYFDAFFSNAPAAPSYEYNFGAQNGSAPVDVPTYDYNFGGSDYYGDGGGGYDFGNYSTAQDAFYTAPAFDNSSGFGGYDYNFGGGGDVSAPIDFSGDW